MSITAYSQKFKRELDIEQLLSLRGHDSTSLDINTKITKLSRQETKEIKNDITCPICKSQGGNLVKETNRRQAHFRFNSHNELCDYNSEKNKWQKGKIIDFGREDFGNNRSNETKIIRELVAKGIEQGIISQQLIYDMRDYFYDTKVKNKYKMELSIEAFQWIFKLNNLKIFDYTDKKHIKFNPVYTQLPDFDWKLAAESLFMQENFNLIEMAHNFLHHRRFSSKIWEKAKDFVRDRQGETVFDVSKLQVPYENTIKLSQFIVYNLKIKGFGDDDSIIKSDMILAFAALLLYIVDWNIEDAILKLIKIVNSPSPTDINSGNVIGLNPFYDFQVWDIIASVSKIANNSKNGYSYKAQIEAIEAELINKYSL